MSRWYRMDVEIADVKAIMSEQVKAAAYAEWDFDEFDRAPDHTLTASGEGALYGGEDEKEFSTRLALAIWRANQGYCKISVTAVYLEDPPYEEYDFGPEEYASMKEELA